MTRYEYTGPDGEQRTDEVNWRRHADAVERALDDMDLAGKIVLTRVDINVPMEAGRVTDATRIERIVPTIKDILAKGGTPVMLAHFGPMMASRISHCPVSFSNTARKSLPAGMS